MNKYTVIQTIRFSKQQAESLQKLKDYDVNVSQLSDLQLPRKLNEIGNKLKKINNG